ncbi:MAG: hypothetical protein QHC90_05325 [Shinella sp.]|nr:hypothetical protein [Shinella sp.]
MTKPFFSGNQSLTPSRNPASVLVEFEGEVRQTVPEDTKAKANNQISMAEKIMCFERKIKPRTAPHTPRFSDAVPAAAHGAMEKTAPPTAGRKPDFPHA